MCFLCTVAGVLGHFLAGLGTQPAGIGATLHHLVITELGAVIRAALANFCTDTASEAVEL